MLPVGKHLGVSSDPWTPIAINAEQRGSSRRCVPDTGFGVSSMTTDVSSLGRPRTDVEAAEGSEPGNAGAKTSVKEEGIADAFLAMLPKKERAGDLGGADVTVLGHPSEAEPIDEPFAEDMIKEEQDYMPPGYMPKATDPIGQPRRVLVCGDLHGRLDLLNKALKKYASLGKPVDFVLCVGRFLPQPLSKGAEIMKGYLYRRGAHNLLPAPVYFIDHASEEFISKGASKPLTLGEDLTFLGDCGVTEIQNLRIAFLSGAYDEIAFKSSWGCGTFQPKDGSGGGANYTDHVLKRIQRQAGTKGVDVLLTSEWPDTYWSTAAKRQAPVAVHAKHTSPAVRELFFNLQPRYHICARANCYKYRKAEQGPSQFLSTFLALAEANDKAADGWHHMLTIYPSHVRRHKPIEHQKLYTRSQAISPMVLREDDADEEEELGSVPHHTAANQLYDPRAASTNSTNRRSSEFRGASAKDTGGLPANGRRLSEGGLPVAKRSRRAEEDTAGPTDLTSPASPAYTLFMSHQERAQEMEQEMERQRVDSGESALEERPQASLSNGLESEERCHQDLPPGWTKEYSEKRRLSYYFHAESGRSQWQPPVQKEIRQQRPDNCEGAPREGAPTSQSSDLEDGEGSDDDLPPGWTKEYSEKRRRHYYFHAESGQSLWEPPVQKDDL